MSACCWQLVKERQEYETAMAADVDANGMAVASAGCKWQQAGSQRLLLAPCAAAASLQECALAAWLAGGVLLEPLGACLPSSMACIARCAHA